MWKKRDADTAEECEKAQRALRLKEILAIPGAKEVLLAFFCYCALEGTAGLWSATYMVRHLGMHEETAASLAGIFYLGITAGRAVSGFMTYKFNDVNMIRMGQVVILTGIVLPLGIYGAVAGLLLAGLGCAPVYPCIIHSTPEHFGAENAQAIIGIQMASAYVGFLSAPPLFGLIANHISASLLPVYLGAALVVMTFMCERLNRKSHR